MKASLIIICILLAGAVVAVIFSATFFWEIIMEARRNKAIEKLEEEDIIKPTVEKLDKKDTTVVNKETEIDLDEMLANLEKRAQMRADKKVEEKKEEVKVAPVEEKKPEVAPVVVVVNNNAQKEEKPEQPKVDAKAESKQEKVVVVVKEENAVQLDYEERLEKLKIAFAKLESDYAKNTRQKNKYEKTIKRKDKNEKLLTRKANELTNLNLAMYNVKDIKDVDPEKKKKQEELTAHIAELKASIVEADTFLEENKEKHQQVVKLNTYLEKEHKRYEDEIAELEKFLASKKK